jgi:ribonuclease J
MTFKIHRGTKEIGGSCVEVWTDTTRIVIDFGMPLVNIDGTPFDSQSQQLTDPEELKANGILPDIPQLYELSENTALLISHAHQDHYGLINYISPDCPVYLGKATLKLIELTNIFANREWKIANPYFLESGKAFSIGDIEIIPYLMDHAAYDAYAFMVKADGKSFFYSGDFRIHGRKQRAFDWFSYNVESNIDYLLLEGTTIGREETRFKTENEIEDIFVETFQKTNGINLVCVSGQNIDRLVSIDRACKKMGKTFVLDFYIANVLADLAIMNDRLPRPSSGFPEIKVRFPNKLTGLTIDRGNGKLVFRFKKYKITTSEIIREYQSIVTTVRPNMLEDIHNFKNLEGGRLIYSMWSGYKDQEYTKKFLDDLKSNGMTITDIHTSGHADFAGLKRMVEVLKPKNIVPIHTFKADKYQDLFSGSNILRVSDKELVKA